VAYNPYIVIPFATWAVAQLAKFVIAALKGRLDFRYLYASGGMPSVHSAVVCSLMMTAGLQSGLDSPIFGLTVILAAIVMYDSFGVRRSSGEQAAALNMLIDSLGKDKVRLSNPNLHLREILGHQPSEVSVGAVVGIVLGALFNYDKLGSLWTTLQAVPMNSELWAYTGLFGLLVVGGIVQRIVLRRRYRKSATMRRLTSRILTATETTGWLGVITVVLQYEHASYLAWRFWSLLVLAVALTWGIVLGLAAARTVPAALAAEQQTARKLKWFQFGRKRKRA
jgi:acid phosphatase family membrane protein YuiD